MTTSMTRKSRRLLKEAITQEVGNPPEMMNELLQSCQLANALCPLTFSEKTLVRTDCKGEHDANACAHSLRSMFRLPHRVQDKQNHLLLCPLSTVSTSCLSQQWHYELQALALEAVENYGLFFCKAVISPGRGASYHEANRRPDSCHEII